MRKISYLLTFFLIIWLCISACKKKSNSSPSQAKFTGCRVYQITESSFDTTTLESSVVYTFYYNDDGTVARINTKKGPATADYNDTYITYKKAYLLVSASSGGSVTSEADSIVIDGQGKVTYIFQNQYGSFQEVWSYYQYDSLGNLVLITSHNYTTVSSQNFQWANGDIMWNTSGTDFLNYVYDASLYNIGNINARIADLENYGRAIYSPKHLHSLAIMDNADTIRYSYTLDSIGKLTYLKETDPGNYIKTTQITYACE